MITFQFNFCFFLYYVLLFVFINVTMNTHVTFLSNIKPVLKPIFLKPANNILTIFNPAVKLKLFLAIINCKLKVYHWNCYNIRWHAVIFLLFNSINVMFHNKYMYSITYYIIYIFNLSKILNYIPNYWSNFIFNNLIYWITPLFSKIYLMLFSKL